MLRIDFNQRFLDHRSILVFVKKLGAITEPEFSELFDDISQLRTVQLPDGRTVHLRYTRHISHQFIEWGSFHMHKKLLGILSVAKLLDDDVTSVKTAHESLKTWYGNTALHSCCFVLGCQNVPDDNRDREFVFINKDNIMKEIESQVADYALKLFLVLEGKKMDKSLEKPEKFAFLRSPLDGEISLDADNRNKKQCIGRMKKYIGDLCLVTGVPDEAIFHYTVAIDCLRSVGDVLWIAGSLEGLCAASLLCRVENRGTSLDRPSLQLDISQLSTAGPVNGSGADGDEYKTASIVQLNDVEIVEKSEEIFQIYEKNREAKVLAIEARFKYARFFLSNNRHKDVSTALQDVLVTEMTFKLSDAEKIQMFSAMAIMYEDIGYMRKAAFFTRKAARHCTSQHLPPQGWTASYNLMRNALDGYKIHFENSTTAAEKERTIGWPDLKIQLMQELIEMSKELQNTNIPIRHISYLIQTMHPHISENEIQDLINSLEKLASNSPEQFNLVDNVVLSNNDILPPVSLTDLPIVREMKVNTLASHLRPTVSPSSPSPVKTPFIFSTLNKGPRKSKKANPVVRWVEGEVGEVAMQVYNPMPFDIKISKMTLLTEGVPFQAFPSCLALSNDNMSHPFMLLGIPEGPGQLSITGYSVELFGIQSNCPITETILDKQFSLPLMIDVTPKLPLLQFHSNINNVKSFINSSHRGSSLTLEVDIHAGQSIHGPIIVENVGKIPVEDLKITLLTNFNTEKNLVSLDEENIIQSLPLQPGGSSDFNLTFHGVLPESLLQDGGTLNWSGKLKISYSGGDAWKLGMSRQAAVDIRIKVAPSLHAANYSVVSVGKGDGDKFEICMDITNQTHYDVEWKFQMNTGVAYPDETTTLAARQSLRTTLELEKFDLSCHDPEKTDRDVCVESIFNLVKLRWQIPDLQITGVLNLDGFKLTEEMVNILRRSKLTLEMSVNDLMINKGDCVSTTASIPMFLTVTVHNTNNEKEIKSSILNIEPFEIDQDGRENFDVKQKICWLGATSTLMSAIPANSTAKHTCGLFFLSPGNFYINIRCFERVDNTSEQPFRDRGHVIKESPSNRRSRSSRTDSFTDSLLLRQRSQSSPLVQFSYSLLFRVQEHSDILEEQKDSSVDERKFENNIHLGDSCISGKDSLMGIQNACIARNETSTLENNPDLQDKDLSVVKNDKNDDLTNEEGNERLIATRVEQVELEDKRDEQDETSIEDFHGMTKNDGGEECSSVNNELSSKNTTENSNITEHSDSDNTNLDHEELERNVLPGSAVSDAKVVENISLTDEEGNHNDEENNDDDNVCQTVTIQDISLNFDENDCSAEETKIEQNVEEKGEGKEKNELSQSLSNLSGQNVTQTTERTESLISYDNNDDDDGETEMKSPSVKDRITFFNSS